MGRTVRIATVMVLGLAAARCVGGPDVAGGECYDRTRRTTFQGVWDYEASWRCDGEGKSGAAAPPVVFSGRVRWELTEEYLIAVLEPTGGDGHCSHGEAGCPEGVVGAWPVRHYDVPPVTVEEWCRNRRSGEDGYDECRVVVEPGTSLPWYLRSFVDVRWSRPSALEREIDRLSAGGLQGESLALPFADALATDDGDRCRPTGLELTGVALVSDAGCAELALSPDEGYCPAREAPTCVARRAALRQRFTRVE